MLKDSFGREHVRVASFGPMGLFLRAIKPNPVTPSTHASDLARVVRAILSERKFGTVATVTVAVDGGGDLNGTRQVNMVLYYEHLKPIMIDYGVWSFTLVHGWGEDSPNNKMEHAWPFGTKHLTGLVIPAFYENDTTIPAQVAGLTSEERKRRVEVVLNNALDIANSKLNQEWMFNITPSITKIPLFSEGTLEEQYQKCMKFFHSSKSAIDKCEKLQSVMKEARQLYAHCDRRHNMNMVVTHIQHEMQPGKYGSAEDCSLCSKVALNEVGRNMLEELKLNGGYFYSPSWDPNNPGHFRTFLQETERSLAGLKGEHPDALMQHGADSEEAKSYPHALFPKCRTCPHAGCWNYRFRSAAESYRHEMVFHPAERKQRLADEHALAQGMFAPARPFSCPTCTS